MINDVETIRLDCLREAVKVCTCPITHNDGDRDVVALAKSFAAFVLGLEWDAESDEWVEPELDPNEDADDSELHPTVRAFNDEGQEL